MLKYKLIDENTITVSVVSKENDLETRLLGDILKGGSDEYEFFTTPSKYFHALWWVDNGDLEELKQKLLELNGSH